MGWRRWSIRMRIFLLVVIPVLSLIGLYAFAATITASDAINLARSRTLKDTIGLPTGNLETQVYTERLLAVIYLAAPAPRNMTALQTQERKTELAQAGFKAAATATMGNAAPQERQAIAVLLREMAGLRKLRSPGAPVVLSTP